jgi:hypothetical protein
LLRLYLQTCRFFPKNWMPERRLISFQSYQPTHNLILSLDKLSIHLIKLLRYESNWIRCTIYSFLCLWFYFDTRILKMIKPEAQKILFNVHDILLIFCQSAGFLVPQDETKFHFKGIDIKETSSYCGRAQILGDLVM